MWLRKSGAARLLATALLCVSYAAHAEVFINEFHYDDATSAGDVGEKIEVIATAGENLSTYRIYLYNGSSPTAAVFYDNDLLPAGNNVTCGGTVKIAVLSYPSNGIQNGANDGFALVNGSGALVKFISYEGAMTASNGPAAGVTSTNLSVSETGTTAAGTSLQLGGTGTGSSSFTWRASATQTMGACNNSQSFTAPNVLPTVTSTSPANGATGVAAASDIQVNFSEIVTANTGAFTLSCSQSGVRALTYPGSGTSFTVSHNGALTGGETCTFTAVAANIKDSANASPASNTVISYTIAAAAQTGYYSRVNTSSASQLRCSLHQTIRGHTVYPYSSSTGTSVWSILEIADEDPNNTSNILDVYRNRSYPKVSSRAGTGTGLTYNREHTWPNSLGFGSTTGNLGLPHGPYTDTHMLYLSDTTYNADRGNKPYGNCSLASGCGERVTEINNGSGGGSGVYPGNSNWVKTPDGNAGTFQAWGKRKGDIARAVLYMAIRYEGGTHTVTGQNEPDLEMTDDRSKIIITSASPAYMGLLTDLLQWHQADPPDAAERARNEVIFSFQGNRNPFIDHPEWATSALFNSTKPSSCVLN